MPLGLAAIAVVLACATFLVPSRSAASETLLQRGAYLTTAVAACGRCHTPRDTQGRPIPGMELAGGLEFDDGVLGHVVVPNITPDRQTGIGGWTQEQIVIAIREGRRPDGTVIGPPMPFSAYRELSDRDVSAIAAYLRTLKAIRYVAAKSQYKIELPANHGPPVEHVKDLPRQDRLAYGAYLAAGALHRLPHAAAGGRTAARSQPSVCRRAGTSGLRPP